jgi:hypothetical protein
MELNTWNDGCDSHINISVYQIYYVSSTGVNKTTSSCISFWILFNQHKGPNE